MQKLVAAYDRLVITLAIIAGVMMVLMFATIVLDVGMRMLGLQPPFWSSTYTEYSLLYTTMLAAPWLVREDGHVRIRSLTDLLSPFARSVVEYAVCVIAIVLCAVVTYYATRQGYGLYLADAIDIRSIPVPEWILYAPLPLGFTLSGIEFARRLYRLSAKVDV